MNDGPLDMRMNQNQGIPASEWLKGVSAEELAWIIHQYGEDDDSILSERIAEAILARQRENGGIIDSTRRLADIIKRVKRDYDENGMHPARLTFQAIRVHLNQEMQQLDSALHGIFETLVFGGRCCVISFKRKESNALRRFVREHEEPDEYLLQQVSQSRLSELFPLITSDKKYAVAQLLPPIRPSWAEVEHNRRSRSSTAHVLSKVSRQMQIPRHGDITIRPLSQRLLEPQCMPSFAGGASQTAVASVLSEPPVTLTTPCRTENQHASRIASGQAVDEHAPGQMSAACSKEVHHFEDFRNNVQIMSSSRAVDEQASGRISALRSEAACAMEDFPPDVPLGIRSRDGYLVLKRGDFVHVVYKGSQSDELGWYYGYLDDDLYGWFPSSTVILCDDTSLNLV